MGDQLQDWRIILSLANNLFETGNRSLKCINGFMKVITSLWIRKGLWSLSKYDIIFFIFWFRFLFKMFVLLLLLEASCSFFQIFPFFTFKFTLSNMHQVSLMSETPCYEFRMKSVITIEQLPTSPLPQPHNH